MGLETYPSMEDAQRQDDEKRAKAGTLPAVTDELEDIERHLLQLQESLKHVHQRLGDHRKSLPGNQSS